MQTKTGKRGGYSKRFQQICQDFHGFNGHIQRNQPAPVNFRQQTFHHLTQIINFSIRNIEHLYAAGSPESPMNTLPDCMTQIIDVG